MAVYKLQNVEAKQAHYIAEKLRWKVEQTCPDNIEKQDFLTHSSWKQDLIQIPIVTSSYEH